MDIITERNKHEHYDFIIGRGQDEPNEYLNFPLNPMFHNRNIIYIDPNPVMNADIKQPLQDVDFSYFGICKYQDRKENINVRFIFDWSSFYCGALQCLTDIVLKIGRRCQILVPLNKEELYIPKDIINTLNNKIFTLSTTEGKYILFDWTQEHKLPINKKMSTYINCERYINIHAFDF